MNQNRRMYLRMITQSLWHRISRALIATLSIAVGATTLSCLGLIAERVPTQLALELRSYGANLVVLPSGAEGISAAQRAAADAAVGDAALGSAAYQYVNLLYNQQGIQAMGTDLSAAMAVRPFWKVDGALPDGLDQLLVGESVAQLYGFDVGDTIGLTYPGAADGAARRLLVTGILSTGGAEDDLVVTTPDTLAAFTGEPSSFQVIEYSVDAEVAAPATVAERISEQDPGVSAQVVRRVSEAETGVARTLHTLIWIVSVIICVLTVISISATLSAVVSERSREIGLKKALGAHTKNVLGEFVGEAALLGLIGGAIGTAAGIWIAHAVSLAAFGVSIGATWLAVALTMLFSVVVSLVASLVPARRIAAIDPVEVLRGE